MTTPPITPCTECGACCSYSAEWPRFTLEDDAAIARLPAELVSQSLSGMRCEGDRCSALVGKVGVATSCSVYAVRPDVCRACEPGDDACTMARARFDLAPFAASSAQPTDAGADAANRPPCSSVIPGASD